MIKKHKIIESHHIALYCDLCGAKMKPSTYRYPEKDFENECPNCGTVTVTKECFPFQRLTFEGEGVPVKINENGLVEDL